MFVQKAAGGTDKAERRQEPGAWVQAQQVPWTTGPKKTGDLSVTMKLIGEIATALTEAPYTQDR